MAGPHIFKWILEAYFKFKMISQLGVGFRHLILMFRINIRGIESPRMYTSTSMRV